MNGSSRTGLLLRILIVSFLLFLFSGVSGAQEQEKEPVEREERPEATPTSQEAIAAIKRRAQQILEERRKARRFKASWEFSQLVGYESNPTNTGTPHEGDLYLEDSLYLTLSRRLTPALTWQGTYSGSYDYYAEYGDGSYTSQTLTPAKFIWRPGRMWRVDGGFDLNITYYPKSGPSNYREFKPTIGIRQNPGKIWFHVIRYEWFIRDYISKKARTGTGTETETNREDTRHQLSYEVGTTWKKALMKVRQEWYFHDSNDARQDSYDAQDYKVTASVNRPLTPKLSANASYSFERKNYKHRQVSGITAEARYDDTQTWTIAGSYEFDKTWSLNPSFSYKFLNSNASTGEYDDATVSVAFTARF